MRLELTTKEWWIKLKKPGCYEVRNGHGQREDEPATRAMMDMDIKEENPHIIADAINIAYQLGFSSLHIPEVTDPEFRQSHGYTSPEGVVSPPLNITIMVNMVAYDHFVSSARQGSQFMKRIHYMLNLGLLGHLRYHL